MQEQTRPLMQEQTRPLMQERTRPLMQEQTRPLMQQRALLELLHTRFSGKPWLFSAPIDLGLFGGAAVLSLVALAVGAFAGVGSSDTPLWMWVPAVLLVDVAHVWATGFRVYFNRPELRRRPLLYGLTPIACFVGAALVWQQGSLTFWRVLAYIAVFHFIRQQQGWVRLYRARAGESSGAFWDQAAVLVAMLYPLLIWHLHRRRFAWFVTGDFARFALPAWCETLALALFVTLLLVYLGRALLRYRSHQGTPGKDAVVATTALCWYVGIVAYNSDYAFTVTNVFIHGIPYLGVIFLFGLTQTRNTTAPAHFAIFKRGPWLFLSALWLFAYAEELLWDRSLWHEHASLFGQGTLGYRALLVPLLATPQLVHYVLDGFIWKRANNPDLGAMMRQS